VQPLVAFCAKTTPSPCAAPFPGLEAPKTPPLAPSESRGMAGAAFSGPISTPISRVFNEFEGVRI